MIFPDSLSNSILSSKVSGQKQLQKISFNSSSCQLDGGQNGQNNYSIRSSFFINNENQGKNMEVDAPKDSIKKKEIFELEESESSNQKENVMSFSN